MGAAGRVYCVTERQRDGKVRIKKLEKIKDVLSDPLLYKFVEFFYLLSQSTFLLLSLDF